MSLLSTTLNLGDRMVESHIVLVIQLLLLGYGYLKWTIVSIGLEKSIINKSLGILISTTSLFASLRLPPPMFKIQLANSSTFLCSIGLMKGIQDTYSLLA